MKILKQILEKLACKHKWRVHYQISIYAPFSIHGRPETIRQTLICAKCGKIEKINL